MSNNLIRIIDYIYDNFRYGSDLENEKIEDLLERFPLQDFEKNIVYEELYSLKIKIMPSKKIIDDKMVQSVIEKESNKNDGIKILNELSESIMKSASSSIDMIEYNFLDELEFDDLNTLLEDSLFEEDLLKLKDVVDKSNNFEYLIEYQKNRNNLQKRKDALDNLVVANQKLVWSIATKYTKLSTVSFDIEDIYQAGMQGLMRAVEKFDVTREYQFSTYAIWWIRQSISRSIANFSTTIRIPVHMREKICKLIRIQNNFWADNVCSASDAEVAKILEISLEEVKKMNIYKNMANLTSLDMTIGDDETSFVGELIPDDKFQSPEKYAEELALKKEISEAISSRLTLKEARILDARFGLTDNRPHTLEEIGRVEKVTRERIRQIEAKALIKLRKSKNSKGLKEYFYD